MTTLLEERPATRDPEVTVRLVTEGAPRGGGGGGRSFGGLLHTAGLGAIAVAILLVVGAITGFVDLGGIFGSTKTTTSTKVLLKELTNLSTFTAAEGRYQVDVEVHDDVSIVPDWIAGGRTVFRAIGAADAQVDFSVLTTDAVQTNTDGSVSITLPPPTVGNAMVDPGPSGVISRSRGIVDRVAGVFEGSPTSEREFYVKGEKRIAKAAKQSKLLTRAEENTIKMLEGFLARLGFTDVTVTFGDPAPTKNVAG